MATITPDTIKALAQSSRDECDRFRTLLAQRALGEGDVKAPVAASSLVDTLNSLAAAEETAALWEAVAFRVERGEDVGSALRDVAARVVDEIVDRGADDTWSGRGNDVRRVMFDAKRDWVGRLKVRGHLSVSDEA